MGRCLDCKHHSKIDRPKLIGRLHDEDFEQSIGWEDDGTMETVVYCRNKMFTAAGSDVEKGLLIDGICEAGCEEGFEAGVKKSLSPELLRRLQSREEP